jgi:glycosyltransferase involved in cell wall biosynthesis
MNPDLRPSRPSMAFFGMFPPVVTGQATANALLCDHFEASGWRVERISLTPEGASPSGKARVAAKIAQYLRAYRRLLAPLPDCIYLSLEANNGKYLSLPIIAAATLAGRPCIIHHHAYSYIHRRPDLALKIMHGLSKSQLHVFQCDSMAAEFFSHLPTHRRHNHLTLSNAFLVPSHSIDRLHEADRVNLGFMGAVSQEKGVFRALEVAALLGRRGIANQLHVAGPCDEATRDEVNDLAAQNNVTVRWRGIVAGSSKQEFFKDIDVFLFPSTYGNETQGIVNLEAMAAGRPVIAIAQCCVRSTIMPEGGLTTETPEEFVALATDAIADWQERQAWPQLVTAARAQFQHQHKSSLAELRALNDAISNLTQGRGDRK